MTVSNCIKLRIADIIIEMKSKFPLRPIEKNDSYRYVNFIYRGSSVADISFEVNLVKSLPLVSQTAERVFLTRHFQSKDINWALFKNKGYYILRDYADGERGHYAITDDFCNVKAYLLKKKRGEFNWHIEDVIYDALQIILINYFSLREGIFTHAVGIKDKDRQGFLFAGKSGQGKSTTAKLWHRYSRGKVLNDDRIIVRRINHRFYIYGSPWHGDFSDYLATRVDRARLRGLFFIFHSKKNKATLLKKNAFRLLYPCVFPTFWDGNRLGKIITTCNDLIKKVPCFRLGFKDTKEVIGFVRNIATTETRKEL